MSFKRLIFSFGALALALVAAPRAQAQTCTTTADCHQGFVCVTNIAPPGPATPAPAPAADPTAPAKTSALVAPQSGYCQAAPCAADSECGPNMVCHTETAYSTCASGGAAVAPCPPNADCVPTKIDPPTCTPTETKISLCAFTWQLPCSTDTDCGAGFMCTPTVTGSCSGSAGTGTATPGSTGPAMGGSAPSTGATAPAADIAVPSPVVPPDQTCTTTTTFPGWCQPKATTCASNTDCPMDWTCVSQPTRDVPVATTMTGAAGTSGTTTPGAGVPADAFVPPTTTPVPVTMVCSSPYGYGGGLYGPKGADSGSGTPTSVGGTGAAGSTGTLPPTTPSPTHENVGNANGTSSSAGCAVGGGSSSVAFAALALLGLALARRRK